MSSTLNKSSFSSRFPAPVIPDGHISISSNMANKFLAAENANQSAGNTTLVDVFPNQRLQMAAFAEEILNVYGSVDPKSSEYASPPALMLYGLTLIHAHAFHTDAVYRPNPSAFAHQVKNDSACLEFFNDLLELPVPPFIHDILKGLARYKSESHNGYEFMHTYAGYRFNQDFPFLVPATLFLTAHNIYCDAPGNAPPANLLDRWFREPILTSGTTHYRVGQFLGMLFDISGTVYTHHDWFNDPLGRIYTPVTQRFHKSRPFFNRMNLISSNFNNLNVDMNPYIYGTGYSAQSKMHHLQVLSKLGIFVKTQFKTTHTLGQIIASNVGSNIVNHFVSEPLLPMHHHVNLGPYVPPTGTNPTPDPSTWQNATDANMASATHFLQYENNVAAANNTFTPPRTTTFRPFVTGTPPTQGPTTTAFTEGLYLVSDTTLAVTAADASGTPPARWSNYPYTNVLFDESRHVTPDIMFHAPLNAPTSAIFSSAISGLWLQSAEVDAISVPTIDSRINLAIENTQNANGLVPIGRTPNFANTDAIRYRERQPKRAHVITSATSLYDYGSNILGRFATAIPAQITTVTGFQLLDGIRYAWEQFSLFTYRTHRATQHTGSKVIVAWSPYRLVQTEERTAFRLTSGNLSTHQSSTDNDAVLIYTTLRGVFGSDTRVYGFPFPASRFN